MAKISWTVTLKGREVSGGCLEAPDERSALDALMAQPLPVKTTESYVVRVGGLVASVYGDEFANMIGASNFKEDEPMKGNHLFGPCTHRSMNRTVVMPNGDKYPECDNCGHVSDVRCGNIRDIDPTWKRDDDGSYMDFDREREKKALVGHCAHNNLGPMRNNALGDPIHVCQDCGDSVLSHGANSPASHCFHPQLIRHLLSTGVSRWDCADCQKSYVRAHPMTDRLRRGISPIHIRTSMDNT